MVIPSMASFEQLKAKHPEKSEDQLTPEQIHSIFSYNIARDNNVEPIHIQCK